MSKKAKPPLVLLHGWGLSQRVWTPLKAALAADWHVVAPDLPGHGAAAPMPVAELEAWTDQLVAHLPDEAVLCGWSLGGMIAIDLARRHPGKAARLILVGTTPRFVAGPDWPHGLDADTVDAFRNGFDNSPSATLQRFVALQALGDARRREVTDQLKAALSATQPPVHASLAAGLRILVEADLRADVAALTQPVRILHGANDALVPVAAAEWMADRLQSGYLSVFGDCGHAPFLSRPADCAAPAEAFALG